MCMQNRNKKMNVQLVHSKSKTKRTSNKLGKNKRGIQVGLRTRLGHIERNKLIQNIIVNEKQDYQVLFIANNVSESMSSNFKCWNFVYIKLPWC